MHCGSARGKCEEIRSHLPRGIRSVGGRLAKAQERTRLPSRVHSRASSVVSLPWEHSFWFLTCTELCSERVEAGTWRRTTRSRARLPKGRASRSLDPALLPDSSGPQVMNRAAAARPSWRGHTEAPAAGRCPAPSFARCGSRPKQSGAHRSSRGRPR